MPRDRQQPTLRDLTDVFRQLGASDPEGWAGPQFREGIQQLARFSFLKGAWDGVVEEGDVRWIDREVESYRGQKNAVGAGAGRALTHLLAAGVSTDDLTELVRTMQWRTLAHVCAIVDGAIETYHNPWNEDEHWHLVLHPDLEKCPFDQAEVGGLHESVLELDPTGREMRPRPRK